MAAAKSSYGPMITVRAGWEMVDGCPGRDDEGP